MKTNPDITKKLNGTVQQQKSGKVPYLTAVSFCSVFLTLFLNIRIYLVSFK